MLSWAVCPWACHSPSLASAALSVRGEAGQVDFDGPSQSTYVVLGWG